MFNSHDHRSLDEDNFAPFFAAAKKQAAKNAGRGMSGVKVETLLRQLYDVLFFYDYIEDANAVSFHLARIRKAMAEKPAGRGDDWVRNRMNELLVNALIDPAVRAVLDRHADNRWAKELRVRASGKVTYGDASAAREFWMIRSAEEAEAGNSAAARDLARFANSSGALDVLAPPNVEPALDIRGDGTPPRKTKQSTINAQNVLRNFEIIERSEVGLSREQVLRKVASDVEVDLKILRERIRKAEIARAKSSL